MINVRNENHRNRTNKRHKGKKMDTADQFDTSGPHDQCVDSKILSVYQSPIKNVYPPFSGRTCETGSGRNCQDEEFTGEENKHSKIIQRDSFDIGICFKRLDLSNDNVVDNFAM